MAARGQAAAAARDLAQRCCGAALPDRLADALRDRLGARRARSPTLPDAALRSAEARLARLAFRPNGSEGFAKAEVTVGGIATAELSSKTMGPGASRASM